MKQKVAMRIQELLKRISINSVGRSAPPGIYEKKISKDLKDAITNEREFFSYIKGRCG